MKTEYLIDANNFREELNEGAVKNFVITDDFFFSRRNGEEMWSVKGCRFQKSVRLESIPLHNQLIFEDCIFHTGLTLSNADFQKGLVFKNCRFEGESMILNCAFNKAFNILNSEFNSKLQFSTISAEELNIDGSKFAEIRINGKFNAQKELGMVNFKNGNFGLVQIKSPEFNANLQFTGGEFDKFYVIDTIINGEIRADGPELILGTLVFHSCKLQSRIDLRACSISGFLKFTKVICIDEFMINEHVYAQFIDFHSLTAVERVQIAYQDNFDMLTLNDCDFKTSFECNSLVFEHVELTSSFSVHIGGILRGSVVFSDIPIGDINLRCSNFGNLTFRDIDTSFITASNFQNHNRLSFSNIEVSPGKSSVNIVDSELDKTLFLNINFSRFTEIVMAKSDVSNVVFSNCMLPTNLLLGSSDPSMGYGIKSFEQVNRPGYHRENYRQLKIAMEKQGNLHAALKYKAKEMHYLRMENNWGWDKVLLYLNFLSNDHGLSWTRGLLFTVIMMCMLYFCYESTLTPSTYDLDSFFRYASSFPLYRMQSEQALTWPTYLVIMISRIAIGYGIYQFIAAFRKFGSK